METTQTAAATRFEDVRYDLTTPQADYPTWERGKPLRTYLLCTHMRSGSTLLGEAMYYAGGMGCPLEYFHVGFQPSLSNMWDTPDEESYLENVYRRRTDPSGSLGVKLFWMDVMKLCLSHHPEEAESLQTELEDAPDVAEHVYGIVRKTFAELFPNPRFIFLTRRDRLHQAISSMISGQVRIWRDIPGVEEREPATEPRYDYDMILDRLRYATYCESRWKEFFKSSGIEPYRITYEDLSADYEKAIRTFLTAIGNQPEARIPSPRLRRQVNRISEEFAIRFLEEHINRN